MDMFEKDSMREPDRTNEIFNIAIGTILDKVRESKILDNKDSLFMNVLSEKDFYPPEDTRYLKSGVCDIDETNNFVDFAKDYFELCEYEELY